MSSSLSSQFSIHKNWYFQIYFLHLGEQCFCSCFLYFNLSFHCWHFKPSGKNSMNDKNFMQWDCQCVLPCSLFRDHFFQSFALSIEAALQFVFEFDCSCEKLIGLLSPGCYSQSLNTSECDPIIQPR